MLTDKPDVYCDICRWCKITSPSPSERKACQIGVLVREKSNGIGYEGVRVEENQDCRIRSSDGKGIH